MATTKSTVNESTILKLRIHEALISKLEELIGLWSENPIENIVSDYNAVLKTLLLLGWRGVLQVDTELPDELILPEYLEMVQELE